MNKELKDKLEELGWFITKEPDGWYLSQYSPAGEDFGFSVSDANFIDDVKDFVDEYDVDEHVELWIDDRGTHGIPSSIKTLLEDAECIEQMLIDLYNGIKDLKVFQHVTDTRVESKERDL